ncbi:hypothetical protein C1H46_004123 [Malus baccata]|uniref:Cation/H(+) antiporter C-terminal domain-containing protein n=1 Tax=Malus baccata TaxID=106549 RepID=A0A540NGX4_MALBA|nr:hypothetical protein C1H46_004123 [Malus baccata]
MHFAMVFIGGADDCEALAYAWRMAGHPDIRLTIIRINQRKKEVKTSSDDNDDSYDEEILKALANTGMEEKLDSLHLDDFRLKSMNVGRRHGNMSSSSKIFCFSDSDELGIVGDAVASSSFMACTSILVVQQGPFNLDEQDAREEMRDVENSLEQDMAAFVKTKNPLI